MPINAKTLFRTKVKCLQEHAQGTDEVFPTLPRSSAHKYIYPVSLWTERTSQTFLSSSQWGQPAWPLGVINMQFTQPDSRGSSESTQSRTRERNEQLEATSEQTTDAATVSRKPLVNYRKKYWWFKSVHTVEYNNTNNDIPSPVTDPQVIYEIISY